MKMLFYIVSFIMLVLLVIVYVSYVNYYGDLIWVPGILLFAGLCFNGYLFYNLFNKLSKHKRE